MNNRSNTARSLRLLKNCTDKEVQTVEGMGEEDHGARERLLRLLCPESKVWLGVLLFLLLFTFLGAVEVGPRTYYPATWWPELGLPEPVAAFKVDKTARVW